MVSFSVEIDIKNDAIVSSPQHEIASMLEKIVHKVKSGFTYGPILDVNGNSVGEWGFHGTE